MWVGLSSIASLWVLVISVYPLEDKIYRKYCDYYDQGVFGLNLGGVGQDIDNKGQ